MTSPNEEVPIALVGLRAAVAACQAAGDCATWSAYVGTVDVAQLAAYPESVAEMLLPLREVRGGGGRADSLLRAVKARARGLRAVGPDDEVPGPDFDAERPEGVPDVPVPQGYVVGGRRGSIYRVREGTPENPQPTLALVTRRWIGLVGASVDVVTGDRFVDVGWLDEGGELVTRAVARATIADARALVSLAAAGAPVTSTHARWVVEWLSACEDSAEAMPTRASTSFGWTSDGVFLWGAEPIGGSARLISVDAGDREVAAGCVTEGTLGGWVGAWSDAEPHPKVGLAVYVSASAALLGVLKIRHGFAASWSGPTSSGKSTSLTLGASLWGDPSGLVMTWDTTRAGAERLAGLCRDMPMMLDETSSCRDPENDIPGVVYGVTGMSGKLRGSRGGGMAATARPRTVLMSTGERPLTSWTQHGGAKARVLEVCGPPCGTDRAASERIVAACAENHGHVGPALVRWLAERRESWPALRARYEELRATHSGGGPAGRAAAYLALLELAAECLHSACGLVVRQSVIDEARRAAALSVADADRPKACLAWALDWMASNPGRVYVAGADARRVPDEVCGHVSDSGVRTLINEAPRLVEDARRAGWSLVEHRDELVRRGWIVPSHRVRLGGRNAGRLYGWLVTHAGERAVSREWDTDGTPNGTPET